jgi:beta-N-acetylhexosaminidase
MPGFASAAASLGPAEKVGQMIVGGFPGGREGMLELSRAVESAALGNLILFSRNAASPPELHAMVREARAMVRARTGIEPLVAIDQEGGVVARLREGMSLLPSAMGMAAAVASGLLSDDDLRVLGRLCGQELLALGIDWNLAPVADVNVNPLNPVIGVRSFGEDPRRVADLATAFAAGLAEAGVLATGKHFPGHGDAAEDSHLGLPLIGAARSRLEAVELLPFRRLIAAGLPVIMTAHVRFPAVEPEPIPATLSHRVLTGLLREELGFSGLIATDCLEMKAIAGRFPDFAVRAVEAGADLLCVSHTRSVQEATAAAILEALASGRIPEARIDASVERILAAKARVAGRASKTWAEAAPLLSAPASLAAARRAAEASITVLRPGPGLPPAPGSLYVDVEPAGLSGAEDRATRAAAAGSVAAALAARAAPFRVVSVPLDPTAADIDRVLATAAALLAPGARGTATPAVGSAERLAARPAERPAILVGLHDAKAHPGQRELLCALARAVRDGGAAEGKGTPLAAVLMRRPYDARIVEGILGPGAAILCAYGYEPAAARAVAAYLDGSNRAPGRCPVDAFAGPAYSDITGGNS